jgi:hypothetical protein
MLSMIGKFFLQGRPWQIFLIVSGMYLIGQIGTFYFLTLSAEDASPPDTRPAAVLTAVLVGVCLSSVFVWLWFLGTSLNAIVQASQRRSVVALSTAAVLSTSYLIVLLAFLRNARILNVMGPLGVVPMVCGFYMLSFAANRLSVAETDRTTTFYEYASPFFLLWFFPLGIWFVQPRINRVYMQKARMREQVG